MLIIDINVDIFLFIFSKNMDIRRENLRPGPQDNSVLDNQANHISEEVWNHEENYVCFLINFF